MGRKLKPTQTKLNRQAADAARLLANENRLTGMGVSLSGLTERPSKALRRLYREGLTKNPDAKRANDTPKRVKGKAKIAR